MNIHVNIIAGEVLLLLEEKNRQLSLAEIQYYLEKPMSLINLAIGKLLREDLIDMRTNNDKNCISIKSNDESKENSMFISAAKETEFSEMLCCFMRQEIRFSKRLRRRCDYATFNIN